MWARLMGKIWKTGVTKGAALHPEAPNRKQSRKPRKAAVIRAAKQARAGRRAATERVDTTATPMNISGNGSAATGGNGSGAVGRAHRGRNLPL
ncbi:hypothetical protein F443_20375 [Phytophthora nicotianae P1569]|uniref:Uncharacterized protein n=2 Tax=Phytophthora nicotianae TaxID=4792 RepID=V9E1B6_PHYNI|nr:hypothetical protein F443_20375 [Phytophthora nicotianae P1569]ETO61626.1 hypothetical protein F444_20379 [Phytophthora nicotianae P1976]